MQPQQTRFEFTTCTLDSQFDSGNLAKSEQLSPDSFSLWISPDAAKTSYEKSYKSWFYFRVSKFTPFTTYHFTIKNIQGQYKQYEQGLTPVFATEDNLEFKPLPSTDLKYTKNDRTTELTISFTFAKDVPYRFAFFYPYSYEKLQKKLDYLDTNYKDSESIFFRREVIIQSLEQRNIDLLIITSQKNVKNYQKNVEENQKNVKEDQKNVINDQKNVKEDQKNVINDQKFLYECLEFKKPIVFLSARVHPGEIPASHLMDGTIDSILNENAYILEHLVFLIVPMINPDGVYRGHWRVDTLGQNLNRFYQSPNKEQQPSIWAIDQIFNFHQKNLLMYIDMHAHSGKQGCFIFGNQLNFLEQVESLTFVRLISLNAEDFDFQGCNFTEKNMYQADKSDGLSKEGSGRVAMYKKYKIPHSYTIECNYTKGNNRYTLYDKNAVREKEKFTNKEFMNWYFTFNKSKLPIDDIKFYSDETFHKVGAGIISAIADLLALSQYSRVSGSPFQRLENLRYFVAIQLISQAPYRFEAQCRSLIKGLHEKKEMFLGAFQQLKQLLEKKKNN